MALAFLLAACAPQGGSSSSGTASSASGSSTTASSTSPSGGSFGSSRTSSVAVISDIPDDSVLKLEEASATNLMADMAGGKIPVSCNVLYDTMGARPDVEVCDPDQIVEIYNRLAEMKAMGTSGMGITDSYHHVIFYLRNGSSVGFSFEGEGLLNVGKTTVAVADYGQLWPLVKQIQDDYIERAKSKGTHKITVAEGKDLIEYCPRSAVPGDTVCVRTCFVTDGSMNVSASGASVENVSDASFIFTMPDSDVQLKAYVSTPPGGGLA